MAKRKRETDWEVIRIEATPAYFVGRVQAPDKESALNAAIKQFDIRREDQSRLLIRPR
jgi:1,2-phenylacetyl-CoA epoxidase PaaB subunit